MTNKYEYERYMNMAQAQNNALANSTFGQASYINPLQGVNIRQMPTGELEQMLLMLTQEYDRRTMDTPLNGPTRRQLQSDEALKHAWEEYQLIAKLKGK